MSSVDERKAALLNKDLIDPFFDRQIRIPDFDQKKIEEQVVLCLGVGGLGSSVAIALVRLGIKKLFIIDNDTIDSHNINRQLLYSKDWINRPKAFCAKEALEFHNIKTEILAENFDVVKNFKRVKEMARESTVIFNCVDFGEYFDIAVQSLALKLSIPLVLGGTFQNTLTVDFFESKGRPCLNCISDLEAAIVDQLVPSKIDDIDHLEFLSADEKPIGASNMMVACMGGCSLVVAWINRLMKFGNEDTKHPTRLLFYTSTFEIERWTMESNNDCLLCGDGLTHSLI